MLNLVGRSVVSAITHTPASGPFVLVTTPPISSLSTRTGSLLAWPALIRPNDTANNIAKPVITIPTYNPFVFLMCLPSVCICRGYLSRDHAILADCSLAQYIPLAMLEHTVPK